MTNGIANGVGKAVPDVIRGWGIYSLIALFMVGAGWIARDALDRQHELIQSVCSKQLENLGNLIADARVDTKAVLQNQRNLVPMVISQQAQIGKLIQAIKEKQE